MALTLASSGQGGVFTLRAGSFGGRLQASVTPPVSATLLLDTYPGAAAAYSLRKLSTAYAGSAIRVRRSSDNAEQNIGFVNNNLDTTSLLAFCGAGSGFVTTWYDQSGNDRNVTQTTTASQPNIVNTGVVRLFGTKPSLYFSSNALTNSTFTLTQPNTYFIVTEGTSTNLSGDRNIFDATGANRNAIGKSNLNSNYFMYAGGSVIYSNTLVDTIKNLFVPIFNTTASYLYKNGVSILSTVNPGAQSLQGLRIGGYLDNQALWESYMPEFIVYNSNQFTNRAAIELNINAYYSIYTPVPTWQGTGTALLDLYPSAVAAYSLRNVSSAYVGPILRVRRSSDNAETDIYGTVDGQLNTTSLTSFVGAGNGFIARWYDQSGGSNHLLQTTSNNQPQIVSSGTYLGYLLYDGVNDSLGIQTANIPWNGSSNALITTVTSPDASTVNGANDSYPTVQIPETAGWGTIYQTVGPTFLKWRFGTGQSLNDNSYTRTSSTAFCIVNTNKTSTTETLYLNNSLVMTATGKLSTMAGNSTLSINIAVTPVALANVWKGFQKEIIMYNSNQSANIPGINANINSYYSIY